MKYTQILDQNMVPEWRNQYLDYKSLNAALNKAIDNKHIKRGRKGLDSYFELIRFDQKFARHFIDECQSQLDKINAFHTEKLSEVKGKYRNLHEQLDQMLTSALYRHIQPELKSVSKRNRSDKQSSLANIGGLFKGLKIGFCGAQSTSSNNAIESDLQSSSSLSEVHSELTDRRYSAASDTSSISYRSREIVRKLSEGLNTTAARFLSETQSSLRIRERLWGDSSSNPSGCDLNQLSASNSSPPSKKKIIASYERKMRNLKFAFRELYFNLVVFEQYTHLNYTGFEQILRKYDRMFASTIGRKFYQEHVQTADFHNSLRVIDNLIESVEHIYTLHFENGNRQKAIKKLQVPNDVYKQSSPMLDFRVGSEVGIFAALFTTVLVVGFVCDTNFDWRTIFRLYRTPLLMIIILFQAAISIIIWKHYKINHVLIFELDPRDNLSFHHFFEFGSLLGMIWAISVLCFLFSPQLDIIPSICPLIVIVILATYLFNPFAFGHYQSRFWLLRKLGRVISAPFYPVKFADFWIADQLVSIVPLFLDLEYLSCFYTTDEVLSVSHLSSDFASRCVSRKPHDLVIRTIVAALPAWFRCAQCLRRWRDENWLFMHLANAGKYLCMSSVVILSSISQYKKTSFELDTSGIAWLVTAIFTSSLTAYWDIVYDFGLFSGYDHEDEKESSTNKTEPTTSKEEKEFQINSKKKKRYPFLRKDLVYPVWVYYFAIVEDWILRFGWIFTISLTEFSNIEAELVVSLLAPLEIFRRFVWNCIRLENEQLNNCGLFRAVRDIPIEVLAPIDESHLDRVIMMMDSKDGPAMRIRLLRRRALKPEKYSSLALHPTEVVVVDSDSKPSSNGGM